MGPASVGALSVLTRLKSKCHGREQVDRCLIHVPFSYRLLGWDHENLDP